MFSNNPVFSVEFCLRVYAKNQKEAFEKAKRLIKRKTDIDVESKKFIAFDFDPEKLDSHNRIEEHVKRLLDSNRELNGPDYSIGYLKSNIRQFEKSIITGSKVEKAEKNALKFVTKYLVQTTVFEQKHPLKTYCDTQKEAIELARQHAERYGVKLSIEKKMILEDGKDTLKIATVSPKEKYFYNNNKVYYFFFKKH